ncbi:uncharacterized protein LOC127865711 [Dreissena polymorpha]|uniref:Uncharacterized protein n=1 Tax=Dreissena polymorpha TaxID=45954 RepID=A0A9D4RBR4_DREPO|nr:uncharacterized protein LOC127865711 [Dreissena polymorpha]KAH3860505.1 hypothetical protein DPMN_023406 [Dreissena polymorpha]
MKTIISFGLAVFALFANVAADTKNCFCHVALVGDKTIIKDLGIVDTQKKLVARLLSSHGQLPKHLRQGSEGLELSQRGRMQRADQWQENHPALQGECVRRRLWSQCDRLWTALLKVVFRVEDNKIHSN